MSVMRIGVLTSGGDTPGMNAAIRAVVRRGLSFGDVVLGVYHGYEGLMDGRVKQLQSSDVHGIIQRGGTILRTARSEVFRTPEGQAKSMQLMTAYEMDALIVIGGDGSFHGAQALAELGMNVMGIPGTIDNDIGYTDFTIGFDTAVNNVMGEMEKIRDTMRSHDRVAVVEVMGRACGDIALWSAMTAPADIVITPESPRDWGEAASQLMHNKLMGRFTSMVIIAEGAGKAEDMRRFGEKYGFETHVVDEVQIDGLPVSSTRVRAAIAAGEMEEAARLLGRPYALCGVIQRGKQLGRKLDFPTANLLWPEGKAIPPKGVYAARVYVDEAWYIAAVNVGTHPTAPGGPPTIEANLLDYEGGSLYGHHMRLLLCSFVRSEKKFDSLEALRDEVMKNREQVRTYFENRR